MRRINKRWFNYSLLAIGAIGILFNSAQILIILAGRYNRNPAIEPDWLQSLDAIALTGLWWVASVIVLAFALKRVRTE